MERTEEEKEFIESCAIMALSGIVSRTGVLDSSGYMARLAFDLGEAMLSERSRRFES